MATQTADIGGGLTATWDNAASGPLTITYDGTGTGVMNDFSIFGSPWYSNISFLTGLTLPDGIVRIGDNAFDSCASMTGTLSLPDSVVEIGDNAFQKCRFSETLVLPANLTELGNRAFRDTAFTSAVFEGSQPSFGVNSLTMNVSGSVRTIAITRSGEWTIPANAYDSAYNAFVYSQPHDMQDGIYLKLNGMWKLIAETP